MYNELAKIIEEALSGASRAYRKKRREAQYYYTDPERRKNASGEASKKFEKAAMESYRLLKAVPKSKEREEARAKKPLPPETEKVFSRLKARSKRKLKESSGRYIDRKTKSGEKQYRPVEVTQSLEKDINTEYSRGTNWKHNAVRKAIKNRLNSQNAVGKGTKARKRKVQILKSRG